MLRPRNANKQDSPEGFKETMCETINPAEIFTAITWSQALFVRTKI